MHMRTALRAAEDAYIRVDPDPERGRQENMGCACALH